MISFKDYKIIKEYTDDEKGKTVDPNMNPVKISAHHGGAGELEGGKFQQKHARAANDYFGGGVGYFTDNEGIADSYARNAAKRTGQPAVTHHVDLDMRNVFDVDHEFTGNRLSNLLPADEKDHEQFARSAGLLPYGTNKFKVLSNLKSGNISMTGEQLFKGLSGGGGNTSRARDHLIKKGYDGLRYNGGANMGVAIPGAPQHNAYISWDANNVNITGQKAVK